MDERALAETLDHFLDTLATGGTGETTGLDPALARIARRYRTLGQSPAPSDVRTRIWQRLDAQARTPTPAAEIEPVVPNGRAAMAEQPMCTLASPGPRRPVPALEPPARRARFTPLAAVVVLMLVVAAGSLVVGRNADDGPTTVPAAVVATPSPDDPVVEPVFTTTVSAAAMPRSDSVSSGLALFTIPVGRRATWEPSCCPGVMIEYVVAGAYGVRAQAPIDVVRASGAVEAITTGTAVTLVAGDALISRNETVVEVWNAGDLPVVLLNWMMIDGTAGHAGHLVPGWLAGPAGIRFEVTPPEGPATITLLRVTLPNGGETDLASPGAVYVGARLTDMDGSVAHRSDGSVSLGGRVGAPFVAYVLKLEPDVAGGTPPVGSPEVSRAP